MSPNPMAFELMRWPVVSHTHGGSGFLGLELEEIRSDTSDVGIFQSFDSARAGTAGEGSGDKDSHRVFSAADHDEEVKRRLAEQYRLGLKEGEAIGIGVGKERAHKEYEARMKRLEGEIRTAIAQFREMGVRAEREAVKLAIDVARKIVELSAEVKPDYIIEVIRRGLRSVGAGEVNRIRIADADFEFMQVVGFPTDISAEELGVQYVPDETLKSGCVIETSFGEIDLRLDEMWEQIRQQILGENG